MPGDFYATLGVPPDASQAAVAAAYRGLALRWHPDRNGDERAVAEFSLVSEAYAVLGDQARRAAYDQAAKARPISRAPSAMARPICCSECGGVTAQPRILMFRSSVGLGLWSRIHRTEGVFCARCARRLGLRASLLTALLGWWAIPTGPFITLWCIGLNACGGSHYPTADRRLALLNAQAFLEQREANLAYALARRALAGADEADAIRAWDIIRGAKAWGIDRHGPVLKDSWRPDPFYVAMHALLLLAPPASVIAALVIFSGG